LTQPTDDPLSDAPTNVPITIRDQTIDPGRSRRFELPVARLPSGTWESMPVAIVNGRKAGPHVFLSGAIHGDEINGVEIIRRVLPHLDARRLAGAVIAVPIVNVFGFINQSRYLPDRRDLNRSFPGSPRGSMAARLAHLFMEEVVGQCQYGIDLHTAAAERINAPQVRANLDDDDTRPLAHAFGARFIIHAKVRDGSLRQAATERGIRILLYEAGAVQRFQPEAVATGVDGILRVLQSLGMGSWDVPDGSTGIEMRKTQWVRAPRSGITTLDVSLGDQVNGGDVLGSIGEALGGRRTGLRAPFSGHVIAISQNPLVTQGDALVHIGASDAEGIDEPAESRRRKRR
jgi:uncharacterized protein